MTASLSGKRPRVEGSVRTAKQQAGDAAEAQALAYLQARALKLVARNFRAHTGEIDLIMQDRDTLVFVEVRKRKNKHHGGAAASVTPAKQAKLVSAARFFLKRYATLPPCRFDVIAVEGEEIHWLKNAIET
ncbi:MAG: YraN family protein [Oxalobacter sp.]|nr:MAG: YraN family protein [Oxalobacter sp.]